MKCLTVSLAVLLLAGNLAAAPDEGVKHEARIEWFDVESALPDFAVPEPELPPLPMMEKHEYEMLAYADEDKHERGKKMDKHTERIQLYRLWRIMENLDLTDDQVDKFFPLMRELGKKEKELARQRHTLVTKMREELSKEEPSEAELKKLLADLKRNARQVIETKSEAIDRGAEILSIEQQARMALELGDVERNIWESIARVRHKPGGRSWENSGFDKQKLQGEMRKLRENLKRISKDLEARGLPGLDVDNDAELFHHGGGQRDTTAKK